MKKIILFLFVAVSSITAHAQFEIDSIGKVTIGVNVPGVKNSVQLGNDPSTNYYNKANFFSKIAPEQYGTHAAIVGDAWNPDYSGTYSNMIGVLGWSGNYSYGSGFGVCGVVANSKGAGIYGSNTANNNVPFPGSGSYAGLFYGPTMVVGTLTSTSSVQSSDINLKENIASLEEEQSAALDKLMKMNPVRYNFKAREYEKESEPVDEYLEAQRKEERERLHFGLIAQELETIYPNLVYKNQDGMLGINYNELIPVLIQSIQVLKEEVDELRGKEKSYAKTMGTTGIDNTFESHNVLYQNTPNPFKESTTIRFNLAEDVKSASICIFDMQGKMLKKIPVTQSEDRITINAFELGEGMFLYTLIADGKEIDTKRMILTK